MPVSTMTTPDKRPADPAAEHLNRLRQWRVRGARFKTAGPSIDAILRRARRAERECGGFAQAWTRCVSPALQKQSRIVSFRGGIATVAARSASVRWALDRQLRGGLLVRLREACPNAITAVRVRNG